jgi:homoserine kinase
MAKPTFKANPIQVQVPATSANLGPGFDSFGLALGMQDRYVAQILDDAGLDIDVTGEGADDVPRTDKNLLVKAMYKGFDFLGGKPKGVAVRALNVIPHGRGLGSSASAIVGGLSLARALVIARVLVLVLGLLLIRVRVLARVCVLVLVIVRVRFYC